MPACRCRPAARLRIAAATFAAAMVPFCALGEPFYGADARIARDDNLTLASASGDRRADMLLAAGAHAGQSVVLEDDDSVAIEAGAHAAGYARYVLLDAVSLEAAASYRRKLGLGLTAPWLSLRAALGHDDFRDDIRDSDRVDISLTAGVRISERLDVSGGYVHDRRFARRSAPVVPGISGAIYDVAGDSLHARAGYAATSRVLVDAQLRVRRGDVVATTPEGFAIFAASNAIAADPAFGPERYGYRERGTTKSAALALSYAVDDHAALNLEYALAWTSAAAGLDYTRSVLSASWIWQY